MPHRASPADVQALFYFRDPAYVEKFEGAPERQVYAAESSEAASRQRDPKDRIRQSQCCLVLENYRDPGSVADRIRIDLASLIERIYPYAKVSDPIERQTAAHWHWAASHARIFVGNRRVWAELDRCLAGENRSVLVSKDPGLGKTTLLSHWLLQRYGRIKTAVELRSSWWMRILLFASTRRVDDSTLADRRWLFHFVGDTAESNSVTPMLQ